jgi:hypothetical protein
MDTTEALKAARLEASKAATSIDAGGKDKLLKHARKHGMTDGREVTELVEAWKRARGIRNTCISGTKDIRRRKAAT